VELGAGDSVEEGEAGDDEGLEDKGTRMSSLILVRDMEVDGGDVWDGKIGLCDDSGGCR
jgi:hypothetical protein